MHLVRHGLNFCSWKDRKAVAADLRRICGAATDEMAAAELDEFEEKRAGKYASIAPAWRRAGQEAIPFFGVDPAIRRSGDPAIRRSARSSTRRMPWKA